MRSVQVFPGMRVQELVSLLDGVGERAGSEWFGIADRRLEVSVDRYQSVQISSMLWRTRAPSPHPR
jgi:hypothetical protein